MQGLEKKYSNSCTSQPPHESIFNQNLNLLTTPSDAKIAKAEMGKILGKIVKTTLLVEFLRY